MTSEDAQCSSRSGFRIFKISREVRVLKQSQSALFRSISPHDNTVCIHTYDEYMKSIDSGGLSQALVHFVMDRASLFTDHKISGRPTRAK